METAVSYDNLSDIFDLLGQPRLAEDGTRWRPIRGTVTLTSSKHVDGYRVVVAQGDLETTRGPGARRICS